MWDCSTGDIVWSQFLTMYFHELHSIKCQYFLLTKRKQHNIFVSNLGTFFHWEHLCLSDMYFREDVGEWGEEWKSCHWIFFWWIDVTSFYQYKFSVGMGLHLVPESGLRTQWWGFSPSMYGNVFWNIGDSTGWSHIPSEEYNETARQLSCGDSSLALSLPFSLKFVWKLAHSCNLRGSLKRGFEQGRLWRDVMTACLQKQTDMFSFSLSLEFLSKLICFFF